MQFLLYLVLYPFIKLISLLPFRVLYFFSDILYILVYKISGYRTKIVRKNLSLVFPEKTQAERKLIEQKFYRHFSDLFLEMIKAFHMPLSQMKKRYVFNNIDLLNHISQKGKSIIIVGGHYANWEWVFSLAPSIQAKPIAVYLKINNKYFEKFMLKNRQRFGGKLIETKKLKSLLLTFKKNKQKFILGLLSDQSPQLHRAKYWRSFLGIPNVPVHTGSEELAKKYDTAFIFINFNKVKRGYYEVNFELITEEPNAFPDFQLTDIFIEKLEKQIRKKPEYYLWTHNRFKHQGKKPI